MHHHRRDILQLWIDVGRHVLRDRAGDGRGDAEHRVADAPRQFLRERLGVAADEDTARMVAFRVAESVSDQP